jgi:hypothetical protein
MATAKKGSTDGYTGRVGNTVTYELNGQMVKREIGVIVKKPSIAQLANQQRTKLCSEFLRMIQEFTEVGFKLQVPNPYDNTWNAATSYNKRFAIKGIYPHQEIDYSNVLLSLGDMPLVSGAQVQGVAEGLAFTWDTNTIDGMRWNDQLLVMAYLPDRHDGHYRMSVVTRDQGRYILTLPRYAKPTVMETYLSFISANHKSVMTSIYLGQVTWSA